MRQLAIFSLLILVSPVWSEPIRQPPGLQPGDKYRLAFVTSTKTTAESSDIETYNAFVQATADAAPIGEWGVEWKAIASTATVDARDNTDTDVRVDESVPIFLVDGTELVPDYDILWNIPGHSVARPFTTTEFGERLEASIEEPEIFVWTGTRLPGVAFFIDDNGPLGSGLVSLVGRANDLSFEWFAADIIFLHEFEFPLYAISEVLIAVPEPSPPEYFLVGLIAMLAARRMRAT